MVYNGTIDYYATQFTWFGKGNLNLDVASA